MEALNVQLMSLYSVTERPDLCISRESVSYNGLENREARGRETTSRHIIPAVEVTKSWGKGGRTEAAGTEIMGGESSECP